MTDWKVQLAENGEGILPCVCGSYPTLSDDNCRPDDGWRTLWCQSCLKHVTGPHPSAREAIGAWNVEREAAEAKLAALTVRGEEGKGATYTEGWFADRVAEGWRLNPKTGKVEKPAPDLDALKEAVAQAVTASLFKHVTLDHSYHEDDNRYPRDFWHVRAWLGSLRTSWSSYGEQEAKTQVPEEKEAAEAQAMETVVRSVVSVFEDALPALRNALGGGQ